jgi:hypothetical protein
MRALALVCLGITILTPEAGAESRVKPTVPAPASIRTGSTNFNPTSTAIPYAIIANSGDDTRRSFAVQLERRVTENDLKRIASDIRLTDSGIEAASAVMMFYLPGMKLGHGVWAHAYFQPTDASTQKASQEPKVTIVGLSIAEEERLVLDARQDSRNLVGAWLTATPAPVGKLTLYREKGRLFAEWGLRDGARFAEEVVETVLSEGGWRYDRREGGTGDHMRVTPEGDLQLRDRNDIITVTQTIKRQPGDFNMAVAKSNQSKIPEVKLSEGKTSADKAAPERKLSSNSVKGTIITTVGSATTSAGSLDKTAKTKTAQPTEQAADPDALANVIFR